MKLSNKCHNLFKALLLPAMIAAGGALTSCESIFDDQGDCSVHYLLSFRYTKNILDTDAFGSQVSRINVALYDRNGAMVYKKSEDRSLTTDNNYKMDIEITPGIYDIIAWCEGESVVAGASSFLLDGQNLGDNRTQSGAHLQLDGSAGNYSYSKDLNRLYYGSLMGVNFDKDDYGYIDVATIDLTKDTNHITVMLQNMNGDPVDPAQISFELKAENSVIDWQNTLSGNTPFVYTPWAVESITSSKNPESKATMADDDIPSGVQAEFTTGRLMANREQRLVVTDVYSGETILNIPLIEYLLLVRSNYEKATSNQDYLDRYDDFTMLFFIDEAYTWIKSRIFINNWRIVPPQNSGL